MSISSVMKDYVGYGLAADLPVAPNIAAVAGFSSRYYATDTTTEYAWDGSAWQAVSGGGGGSSAFYSNPTATPVSADTGAFATMGNVLCPFVNVSIVSFPITFNPTASSQTFKAMICTVDASDNITGTVATSSNTITSSGSGPITKSFTFASPVALTAGTVYLLALVRTDGSGTSSAGLYVASGVGCTMGEFPHDHGVIAARRTGDGPMYRVVYAQNSSAPTSVSLGAAASGGYGISMKMSV